MTVASSGNWRSAFFTSSPCHQWQGAFQLFQLLQSRSLQPDEISFGAASTACIRGREWAKALGLLASVWRQKPPSLLLFTSALRAAQLGGRWQLAVALLEEMHGFSQQPDLAAFNPGLGACVAAGQWSRALELAAQMPEFSLQPDSVTKRLLLQAWVNTHSWQGSLELMSTFG